MKNYRNFPHVHKIAQRFFWHRKNYRTPIKIQVAVETLGRQGELGELSGSWEMSLNLLKLDVCIRVYPSKCNTFRGHDVRDWTTLAWYVCCVLLPVLPKMKIQKPKLRPHFASGKYFTWRNVTACKRFFVSSSRFAHVPTNMIYNTMVRTRVDSFCSDKLSRAPFCSMSPPANHDPSWIFQFDLMFSILNQPRLQPLAWSSPAYFPVSTIVTPPNATCCEIQTKLAKQLARFVGSEKPRRFVEYLHKIEMNGNCLPPNPFELQMFLCHWLFLLVWSRHVPPMMQLWGGKLIKQTEQSKPAIKNQPTNYCTGQPHMLKPSNNHGRRRKMMKVQETKRAGNKQMEVEVNMKVVLHVIQRVTTPATSLTLSQMWSSHKFPHGFALLHMACRSNITHLYEGHLSGIPTCKQLIQYPCFVSYV